MYGSWSAFTFGGVVFAVLLVLGLLVAPWGAGIALLIALILSVVIAAGFAATRGASADQANPETATPSSRPAAPANPRTGGEPVSGEGSSPNPASSRR